MSTDERKLAAELFNGDARAAAEGIADPDERALLDRDLAKV